MERSCPGCLGRRERRGITRSGCWRFFDACQAIHMGHTVWLLVAPWMERDVEATRHHDIILTLVAAVAPLISHELRCVLRILGAARAPMQCPTC